MPKFLRVTIQADDFSSFGLNRAGAQNRGGEDCVQKNVNLLAASLGGSLPSVVSTQFFDTAIQSRVTVFFINVVAGDTISIAGNVYEADNDFAVGATDEETLDNFIEILESTDFYKLFTTDRTNAEALTIKGLAYIDYSFARIASTGGIVLSGGSFAEFNAPSQILFENGQNYDEAGFPF
jgi:hypothetical protein